MHCYGPTIVERFKARALDGARHPGHVDETNILEFQETLLQERRSMLGIDAFSLDIDTTDIGAIDLDEIIKTLEGWLGNCSR